MSKQSSVDPEEKGARGNSKQAQLLVLLLLLASFWLPLFFYWIDQASSGSSKESGTACLDEKTDAATGRTKTFDCRSRTNGASTCCNS